MFWVLLLGQGVGKVVAVLLWKTAPWSPLGALCWFVPDVFVLYHLFVPSGQWLCPSFTHFVTHHAEVWLTIDDGPDGADTPRILDLLDQHDARATFFVVGERVARWPQLVAEIVRRGHEIGHHTHTHPVGTFWCALPTRVNRELDDTLAVLRSLGVKPQRFRPPVGIKNLFLARALASRGLDCVGWTVRSGDCLARRPEDVVEKVMRQVRPGAILLLHEGQSVSPQIRVAAIKMTLERLTARNFRCVIPRWDQLAPATAPHAIPAVSRDPAPTVNQAGAAD